MLEGGEGTEHLWGGAWSADGHAYEFVHTPGDGKDFVHDFELGIDLVDLSAYRINFATLSGSRQDQGWATKIDLAALGGLAGDMLYLKGVAAADLDTDDFLFGVTV
ncbi:MAG: hypothetical protein MK180_06410 [Rhodobacteraceae bacterium]|nr:hypothetical protein [Paracoccaceae bacterium]